MKQLTVYQASMNGSGIHEVTLDIIGDKISGTNGMGSNWILCTTQCCR